MKLSPQSRRFVDSLFAPATKLSQAVTALFGVLVISGTIAVQGALTRAALVNHEEIYATARGAAVNELKLEIERIKALIDARLPKKD